MSSAVEPIERGLSGDGLRQRRSSTCTYFRRCLTQFIGLLFYVFIGTLQGVSGGSILVPAFAHGITIALLIMAFGHISGGHFNPAVTLGVFVSGHMHAVYAGSYIIAQLLGGFVGSLLARACVTSKIFNEVLQAGITVPPVNPLTNEITVGWFQLIVLETVLTFLLVTAVLNAAVDHEGNALAPFAIGLAVFVDILAGGKITGASMNPARSFGPAVAGSIFGVSSPWRYHYVYWIGPLVGGALAGVVYKLVLGSDGKRWIGN